jgi:diguanylate cyclase (GGDEF)-like protein/PAS domain S-box-containing protein
MDPRGGIWSKQVKDWQDQIDRLLDAHASIIAVADQIDAAFEAVVKGSFVAMPQASGAVIEMRDGDEIVYRAASGAMLKDKIGLRLKLAGSLSGTCLTSGEPQLCHDSETDNRVNRDACRATHVRSMVVVPIPFQGENVAVLKVFSGAPEAFSQDDVRVACMLVAPIACSIASAAQLETAQSHKALARRFEATFDQAAVGMVHVDTAGRFLRVNDRFCAVTGRSAEELYACNFRDITHPDDLAIDLEQQAALTAGEIDHYQLEKRYLLPDGGAIWTYLTVSMVALEDGTPDFYLAVVEDISQRKEAENLALRDALTGLPNRRAMLQRLATEMGGLPDAPRSLAVAYLDLDHFKQVNDRLGHAVGDECLIEVAKGIQGAIRTGDTLYRIAGDEFVLLLPGAGMEDVDGILRRLNDAIAARIAHADWRVGVSSGAVVLMPGTSASVEEVINAADRMMYEIKKFRDQLGHDIEVDKRHKVRAFDEIAAAPLG